jgi:hypothetical protein
MVKSLFFRSKKIENVANLTVSLAVVYLGGVQRQIYVCVALHSFIYFNGQIDQHPLAHQEKRMVLDSKYFFCCVLVPRANHGV